MIAQALNNQERGKLILRQLARKAKQLAKQQSREKAVVEYQAIQAYLEALPGDIQKQILRVGGN